MTTSYSLNELADLIKGKVAGDGNMKVTGLNSIELAGTDDITFVTSARALGQLVGSNAAAAIVPLGVEAPEMPCIQVENAEFGAAVVLNHFLSVPFQAKGIHASACTGVDCRIPQETSIGPLSCIGDRVCLGERVMVCAGVVIGDDCIIGDDTVLHANVTIAERSIIGSRVIIHSGTVVGSDGFGYATDKAGNHTKKPQIGNVQIDDNVEIGANSCVDRAAFGTTRIRSGVKIDNLVMIAHNVDIGENSILVAQVGIAGSTTLGKNVVLGGQAGVAGHLHLGDQVMAAAMAGVHSDVPAGSIVGGAPAFELKKWRRATVAFSRLPDMVREMRLLRKEVDRLTGLLDSFEKK